MNFSKAKQMNNNRSKIIETPSYILWNFSSKQDLIKSLQQLPYQIVHKICFACGDDATFVQICVHFLA